MDMFAMGCILAEMITLRPLLPGSSEVSSATTSCLETLMSEGVKRMSRRTSAVLVMVASPRPQSFGPRGCAGLSGGCSDTLACPAQIDELHKMSALMGPPTMETWPEGVMLGIGMGFSFVPQQPIPLQLMVRNERCPADL